MNRFWSPHSCSRFRRRLHSSRRWKSRFKDKPFIDRSAPEPRKLRAALKAISSAFYLKRAKKAWMRPSLFTTCLCVFPSTVKPRKERPRIVLSQEELVHMYQRLLLITRASSLFLFLLTVRNSFRLRLFLNLVVCFYLFKKRNILMNYFISCILFHLFFYFFFFKNRSIVLAMISFIAIQTLYYYWIFTNLCFKLTA